MERQKDMTLEDKPPCFIDVQNTTGEDQRNKEFGVGWRGAPEHVGFANMACYQQSFL